MPGSSTSARITCGLNSEIFASASSPLGTPNTSQFHLRSRAS